MILGTWGEAARSLVFMRVRWERVTGAPGWLAVLAFLPLMLAIGFQRVYILSSAQFDWNSMGHVGMALTLLSWASFTSRSGAERAPNPAQLLAVLLGHLAWTLLFTGMLFTSLLRTQTIDQLSELGYSAAWYGPIIWAALAQLVLLLRLQSTGFVRRFIAPVLLVCAAIGTAYALSSSLYWTDLPDNGPSSDGESFALTQELMENQLPLLDEQLELLAPQRPGVIDTYTITFAPYEGQEVFRNESTMVSKVMAARFDAQGRGLQLINHRATVEQLPWATTINLQRAIEGIADVMDKNEDVLFIHLTSHGASNGELAAQFDPMAVDPVVPAELRKWLDQAGIRYRVLSISACFAGNWIKPLSAPGTLVMTASDADHTSFGCGAKSELTFFGRAMYDEQIRSTTLDFEQAHAAARKIILKRENEAGKDDGYSNPQIAVGAEIRGLLARQRAQLAAVQKAR